MLPSSNGVYKLSDNVAASESFFHEFMGKVYSVLFVNVSPFLSMLLVDGVIDILIGNTNKFSANRKNQDLKGHLIWIILEFPSTKLTKQFQS